MSTAEIIWRLSGAVRDASDRLRFALKWYPKASDVPSGSPPAFRLTDIPVGWSGMGHEPLTTWRRALVARADHLLAHRFTFFNLVNRDLGNPVDWNRDHESGRAAPMSFAPAIDYRDASSAGDAKVVWEPSRHQHLVVLARAYRATGDIQYAREVVAQIESWLDQSPFWRGMNWRSPLEFAIRIINWVWALDLIRESGVVNDATDQRIRHAVYLHVWEIARKYSRGSSANNHLVGEAAGVYVATAYFSDMPRAAALRAESRAILEREVAAQTHADGGTREQATGYHLFVLQFYLACGSVAKREGADFGPEYWRCVERMYDFVLALVEGGPMPMIGDADDGYVLDLGVGGIDMPGLLSVGADAFGRSDLARMAGGSQEWAFWLRGQPSAPETSREALGNDHSRAHRAARPIGLVSKALVHSGYYLLQAGTDVSGISVVIDCGELGYGPLAAHGHADALSLVLRVDGQDVLVDPGTYDYFTFPEWRRYLRGTQAHNTVTIDGKDQSVITGAFMWGRRAVARCVSWSPDSRGGVFEGEHDGYVRLPDPVAHRRRISLDGVAGVLTITDAIVARAQHVVECRFHFAETCVVSTIDTNELAVTTPSSTLKMTIDSRLTTRLVSGNAGPDGGWVSRGYHRKVAAPVVIAEGVVDGTTSIETLIRIG
jgi:uncharacterized heparinase superfamily protein